MERISASVRKERTLELRRKLFHLTAGILIVALVYYNVLTLTYLLILFVLGVILSVVSCRWKLPVIHWFLKTFERKDNFPGKGALFMLGGCIIVLGLFEKNSALAALMILALGDSISPIVGGYYGKTPHPLNKLKLAEGTLAGIVAATLGAALFVPWKAAAIASFVALCIEAAEIKLGKYILDDNITVPFIAGLVLAGMGI